MSELPDLHLVSAERLEAIRRRVFGPVVFNVVCSAYSNDADNGTDGRTRVAWLCDGKQNTGEFAAPCQLPLRYGQHTLTVCIFRGGQLVVTGAPDENVARAGLWQALKDVFLMTGYTFSFRDLEVVNVHSVLYMNCPLDIKAINAYMGESNHIEEFIKMVKIVLKNPSVTCLVYKTGSIVLTGASRREQLVEAARVLVPFLANFVVDFDDTEQERARVAAVNTVIQGKLAPPSADL
jgi:transcription initiation factor TFIID TATA-box-binding protein